VSVSELPIYSTEGAEYQIKILGTDKFVESLSKSVSSGGWELLEDYSTELKQYPEHDRL